MTEKSLIPSVAFVGAERPVAAVSVAAGFTALFSAAACCVLPAALTLAGVGAGGFAFVVPYHRPLTIASGVAAAVGWALYFRRRRACASDPKCAVNAPSSATFLLLSAASLLILLSVAWKAFFEAPLQTWLLTL